MIVAAAQAESRAGELAHNVATAARLARSAGERGARLVVLPEAFLTGYDDSVFVGELPTMAVMDGAVLDPLRLAAASYDLTVVASAALQREVGRTLSAVVVRPDGEVVAPYDKQHLDDDETRWFTPGEQGAAIDVDGVRFGLSICYDGSFPDHARAAVAAGAAAYLASVAYFPGGERRLDVTYAARALDNAVPVVVSALAGRCGARTFIGGSAIHGPRAEVLARCGDGEGVVMADIAAHVAASPTVGKQG